MLRGAPIGCLTETYNAIPDTDYWRYISVKAPPTMGRHRRGGGVSILHYGAHNIHRSHVHAEEKFQFIATWVDGVPIVTAYVSPETNRAKFDRFIGLI